MRAEIEEAAQFALDTADRLIALLEGMNGEPGELGHTLETTFVAIKPVAKGMGLA